MRSNVVILNFGAGKARESKGRRHQILTSQESPAPQDDAAYTPVILSFGEDKA